MGWNAKSTGGYAIESGAARNNALEIANVLIADGWSTKAISAMLGNVTHESGLNPWRWQGDYAPTFTEFVGWSAEQAALHGYGLVQFTPANTYINANNAVTYSGEGYSPYFSDKIAAPRDGNAQMLFFLSIVKSSWLHQLYNYYNTPFLNIGVDISPWYYTTYENFKKGINNAGKTLTLAELTGAFELCYERPAAEYAASSYNTRVSNAEYWYKNLGLKTGMPWIYYLKRRR
jgi:hypothetical protein